MKKWILSCLAAVLVLTLTVTVGAQSKDYMVDRAGLLTADQETQLESRLCQLSKELEADIVVVLVPSLEGASAMNYADDCYDKGGYANDGVLLLIAQQERQYWISTSGRAIKDVNVDQIKGQINGPLSQSDWSGACYAFADACRGELKGLGLIWGILICLGIGIVVGLIAVLIMKGKLKTVRSQAAADSYIQRDSVTITHSSDTFLFQTVTRRQKPQNNSSGSHTSSSGRSHGGGGGSF